MDSWPIFCAVVTGLVGLVGCITAIYAWVVVKREQTGLRLAEGALISDESWQGCYTRDSATFSNWLRDRGITPHSHLSDSVRSYWAAWMAGRSPSLAELHALVNRRERSRLSSRLSGGIAALLLVLGIVGTLSSIHPILTDFELPVSASGVQEVSKGAESVQKLLSSLGNAFVPSLMALVFTVLVVVFRGFYLRDLHRFTLELDGFAIEQLATRYRLQSLSDQYREVKESLIGVSDSILSRERLFETAVGALQTVVEGVAPVFRSLTSASRRTEVAANNLATGAESLATSLTQNLGDESPLLKAIDGVDQIFKTTEESLKQLSGLVAGIGTSIGGSQTALETAIKGFDASIVKMTETHMQSQHKVEEAVNALDVKLKAVPGAIESSNKLSMGAAIKELKSCGDALQEEVGKQLKNSVAELASSLEGGLKEVTDAAKDLKNQSDAVNNVLAQVRTIPTEVTVAVTKQTEDAGLQIKQSGDDARLMFLKATSDFIDQAGRANTDLADSLKAEIQSTLIAQAEAGRLLIDRTGENARSSISQAASHLIDQTGRVNSDLSETLKAEVQAALKSRSSGGFWGLGGKT